MAARTQLLILASLIGQAFLQWIPEIPKECENADICENVPNYPHEHVEKIIEKHGLTKRHTLEPGIEKKDENPRDINICSSIIKHSTPYAAKENGRWRYIINRKKNPLQVVPVEICSPDKKHEPCGNGLNIELQHGYTSHCEQKRMKEILAALDDEGNLTTFTISVPCCCSCVLSHSSNNKT